MKVRIVRKKMQLYHYRKADTTFFLEQFWDRLACWDDSKGSQDKGVSWCISSQVYTQL